MDFFQSKYGEAPTFLIRAPGRVNLIGEHTDYNDGFVLPLAINRAQWTALRPRHDKVVSIYSMNTKETIRFGLDAFDHTSGGWGEYVKGVAWALQNDGYPLHGWEGIVMGNIPIGAGLSSSAALELSTIKAFSLVSQFDWDPVKMAQLSQVAENNWVGVNCGIMDQITSAMGKEGHALLIDCRSLEIEYVPLPPNTVIVIMDTSTRRELVDSFYNERRRQCELAAKQFGVRALRDITLDEFTNLEMDLDPITRKRARHVVTENDRVLKSGEAMKLGDAKGLGELMYASHISLRDDFEVSSKELNIMVEIAQAEAGCFGARMTGAGFGGSAVALIHKQDQDEFISIIKKGYKEMTGLNANVYLSSASNGVSVEKIESLK
jgi:galactokinase